MLCILINFSLAGVELPLSRTGFPLSSFSVSFFPCFPLFFPLIMDSDESINNLITHTNLLECTDTHSIINGPMENEYTLIAKLFTEKATNITAFKDTLIKSWRPTKRIISNHLHHNTVAFIFEKHQDFLKVLNSSWSFRNSQVII